MGTSLSFCVVLVRSGQQETLAHCAIAQEGVIHCQEQTIAHCVVNSLDQQRSLPAVRFKGVTTNHFQEEALQ